MSILDEFRGDGPLRDVTVLDFSQMMMGPLATQLMGDLGALVIKVERPVVGEWIRSYAPQGHLLEGHSPYFLAMNRNKLSLAVELKDVESADRLRDLVRHVDAVVHNFRPGVMERLGFGPDALRELNPALVYASGSGFGTSGPWVANPGQDLLVQAVSGLAANSGPATVPPVPVAAPVVDAATGFVLAFHVMAAVHEARREGVGRNVEASLLGTALLMQCQEALVTMNMDLQFRRSGAGIAAPWTEAPYGIYETSDGCLALSMVSREQLAAVLKLPEELLALSDEEWFEARDRVALALRAELQTRTTTACLEDFERHDIWVAPVLSLEDVLRHPQVDENAYTEQIRTPSGSTVRAVGMACKVSGLESASRLPPPSLGEHNDIIWQAAAEAREAHHEH